jgi:hypothetical protein
VKVETCSATNYLLGRTWQPRSRFPLSLDSLQLHQCSRHDQQAGGSDGQGGDGGGEAEEAGPGAGKGAALQEAAGVEEEETDAGEGRGQAEAEGEDYQQAEPGAPNRDRAKERQQRRGAGEDAAGDAKGQQAAPGHALPLRTRRQVAMRVAAMRMDVPVSMVVIIGV